jgi:hypothetical protein
MVTDKSLKNLIPAKKGEVRNPHGRPKKEADILTYIRAKLDEVCEYDKQGRTWLEALADAELRYALEENAARIDLFNRIIGKPQDSLALSGNLNMSWCELAKRANNNVIEPDVVDNNG